MTKIFTVSILGCGSRGQDAYAKSMLELTDKFKIVSLCDNNQTRLNLAKQKCGVKDENCFLSVDEFFKEKRSDALVIATQDRDHVSMCIKALELGYDVLLEKPISPLEEELYALKDANEKYINYGGLYEHNYCSWWHSRTYKSRDCHCTGVKKAGFKC
jgi:predicted dehydrogenase